MILLTPRSTLFPYTTLFRSLREGDAEAPEPVGVGVDLVALDRAAAARHVDDPGHEAELALQHPIDRKSTRLNSSHQIISYAVFCLKKKKKAKPKFRLFLS